MSQSLNELPVLPINKHCYPKINIQFEKRNTKYDQENF